MSKIKVYLDTNTAVDFFINQAKAARIGKLPIVPEKLKFFKVNYWEATSCMIKF